MKTNSLLTKSLTKNRSRSASLRKFLALILGLLVASFSSAQATDGTWNNSDTSKSLALTWSGTGSIYSVATSGSLTVGDALTLGTSGGGLTDTKQVYFVTAVDGSGLNYTLSKSPGGATFTGVAGSGSMNGVMTWDAVGATTAMNSSMWTSGNVPNGTDAVATFGSTITNLSKVVAIQNPITIGTLIFNGNSTNKDLNLISSSTGGATLSALTFQVSSGTPIITNSNTNLMRLGLGDASFQAETLKISGTQGLILNSTSTGGFRIENVDWSGFTDGAGGMGTLTVQQGAVSLQTGANILGTGTGAINVTVGNVSTTGSGALLSLSAGQTVNILNGASLGRISGAQTLTVGAGNGSGGDFAGIIGQDLGGGNSNTNLTKTGSGTQTISGTIVSATGNVTVNGAGGTLILSGSNSYGGSTTVTAGTLRVTNANGLGATTSVGIGGSGILDLRQDSSVAFTGTGGGNVAVATSATNATINVDQATGAGTGQTMTIGALTIGSSAATANTNFTGAHNTSLIVGAVTNATAASGTTQFTNNIIGGGSLTLASFADTRTGTPTLTFSGSGNTTVSGAITQTGTTSLTYNGVGTLTLNGSSNITGVTTPSAGTLKLGNPNALGTSVLGAISTFTGTLDFNGNAITNTIADKALSGGTLTNTGAAVDLTGMGNIGATAARAFNLDGTGNMAFGQNFTGQYAITKNGINTVTLSGTASVVTKMTVNNGTLVVNGSLSAAASGTTVNLGTLAGAGTLTGAVNVGGGGGGASTAIIAPGTDGTIGTLKTGALSLNSTDAVYKFDLQTSGGLQNDQIVVTGALTLGTGVAHLTGNDLLTAALANGTVVTLATTTTGITGTFAGLAEHALLTIGANTYQISYGGDVANALTLTTIPEPGTWAMLIGGIGMLGVWQRSRRRKA
jgi:autotransporter-associated beta strand protein